MLSVILLVTVATAVAELTPMESVPTILDHATAADVLLYLYDVMLTSHIPAGDNNEGGITELKHLNRCPDDMPRFSNSGNCAPTTAKPITYDIYDYSYDY